MQLGWEKGESEENSSWRRQALNDLMCQDEQFN